VGVGATGGWAVGVRAAGGWAVGIGAAGGWAVSPFRGRGGGEPPGLVWSTLHFSGWWVRRGIMAHGVGVFGWGGCSVRLRFPLRGGVSSGGGGGVCVVDCEARGVRRGCLTLTLAGGLRLRDGFCWAGVEVAFDGVRSYCSVRFLVGGGASVSMSALSWERVVFLRDGEGDGVRGERFGWGGGV
jgi:hypothetical protein